jgi:C-terminal processing protease CtpA/Prc
MPVIVAALTPGDNMRLRIEVDKKTGPGVTTREERTFILPVTKGAVEGRLQRAGLTVEPKDGKLEIVDIAVDSPAERARLDIGDRNRILGIEVRNPQPDKAWFTLPAWVLLAAVVVAQRRRQQKDSPPRSSLAR